MRPIGFDFICLRHLTRTAETILDVTNQSSTVKILSNIAANSVRDEKGFEDEHTPPASTTATCWMQRLKQLVSTYIAIYTLLD